MIRPILTSDRFDRLWLSFGCDMGASSQSIFENTQIFAKSSRSLVYVRLLFYPTDAVGTGFGLHVFTPMFSNWTSQGWYESQDVSARYSLAGIIGTFVFTI